MCLFCILFNLGPFLLDFFYQAEFRIHPKYDIFKFVTKIAIFWKIAKIIYSVDSKKSGFYPTYLKFLAVLKFLVIQPSVKTSHM